VCASIIEHTLAHLDAYLTPFEANATQRGAQVHWARAAAEPHAIVYGILHDHGVTALIKSKSRLQEECVMTPSLAL
jgi:L-lactate dehydrogenase complex protein LldF